MLKLLFVDFDGIINKTSYVDENEVQEWRIFYSYKKNHDLMVKLLEKCHKNNVRVVVSSTWRRHFELINPFFRKYGMPRDMARSVFQHHTPIDYKFKGRGAEIQSYIDSLDEDVDCMCIVDDEFHNILEFKGLKDRFYKVDSTVGFTEEDLEKVLNKLNI